MSAFPGQNVSWGVTTPKDAAFSGQDALIVRTLVQVGTRGNTL